MALALGLPMALGGVCLGSEPVAAVVFQSVGPGAWQGTRKRTVAWWAGLGDSLPPVDLKRVLLATGLNVQKASLWADLRLCARAW